MIKKDEQMNTSDISFDEMAKLKSDGGDKTDRLILGDGENCIFSSDSNKTGLNNNILVIGTSGCGKTVSIMEPRILETFNRSLIATVTKRRIVKKYSVVMKRRGYKVLDLNFVHPSEGNCGYDPLMHIGSYNDITFLARSIVLANPQKAQSNADPYWDDGATSLFSAEICYILQTKDNATFADVLDFHNKLTFEERNGVIATNYDRKYLSEDIYFFRKDRNIPEYYIESCPKIKYLFPYVHAAEYCYIAFCLNWFKCHDMVQYFVIWQMHHEVRIAETEKQYGQKYPEMIVQSQRGRNSFSK